MASVAAHDDTLDALHRKIASCRRCVTAGYPIQGRPILSSIDPLPTQAGQASRADRPRRVMLIGQAPGRQEAAGGQPFMGPAGRRLFAWLERIGIDERSFRQQVYMTAVTKCYPGPSACGPRRSSPVRPPSGRYAGHFLTGRCGSSTRAWSSSSDGSPSRPSWARYGWQEQLVGALS